MVVLPDHVLGVPEADSYQNLFRYDVDKLIETAKAAGVEPKQTSTEVTDARRSARRGVRLRQPAGRAGGSTSAWTRAGAWASSARTARARRRWSAASRGCCSRVRAVERGPRPDGAGDRAGPRPAPRRATRRRRIRFAYMPQHRAMELHWPMTGLDAAALATSARRPLRLAGRLRRRRPRHDAAAGRRGPGRSPVRAAERRAAAAPPAGRRDGLGAAGAGAGRADRRAGRPLDAEPARPAPRLHRQGALHGPHQPRGRGPAVRVRRRRVAAPGGGRRPAQPRRDHFHRRPGRAGGGRRRKGGPI